MRFGTSQFTDRKREVGGGEFGRGFVIRSSVTDINERFPLADGENFDLMLI